MGEWDRMPTALRSRRSIPPSCLEKQRGIRKLKPLRLLSRRRGLLVEVAHRVVARGHEPLSSRTAVQVRETVQVVADAARRQSGAASVGAGEQMGAPAAVPELTYNDVVIVDGRVASVEIARLLFVADKIPRHERDRVRQELLDYCQRDTWAMVKLVEKLRSLC